MHAPSLFSRLQTTQLPHDAKLTIQTILTHLNHGNLTKSDSTLFSSPFPLPHSLYARLFQYSSSKLAILEARKLESHLLTFNPTPPTFLLNRAIETYGKCGCLDDALQLFDEMPQKDGGSWNAMITAYSQNRCPNKALLLFSQMNKSGVAPNNITFASVLGSCASLLALSLSEQVHGLVVKFGWSWNVILGSSLVDIYGKCGLMGDARRMFDELSNPNAVSWNVIVRRYLEGGDEKEAVVMFFNMIRACVWALNFTFSNALIACSRILAVNEGKQIHGITVKVCCVEDEVITDSLINMYVKCGLLEDARQLHDQPGLSNVVSSTSVVSGYAMCGKMAEACELFNGMPERSVISWNAMLAGYTLSLQWEEALDFVFWMLKETQDIDQDTVGLIINVCAGLSNLELGRQVHGFVYRRDFCSSGFVGNALLDMYGKCGSLRSSKVLFLEMGHQRDWVSWNALITGLTRHGMSEEAMIMFPKMLWETTPTGFTFSTLLAACANIFALEQGKQIHCYMLRNGYNLCVVVRGALVDMYSKCRSLEYGIKVFKQEASRDLILWNSMVLGCAHNGYGVEVLELFSLMHEEGIEIDNITFQAVFLACIGEGYVELGKQYFNSMSDRYCVIPRLEHYECMIELFSRYGVMDELEDFVHKLPFEPTVPMLTRVFDACREHRYSRLGEWAAEQLNQYNPLTPFRFEILPENTMDKG